jgi:hypothetical protein
MSLLAQDQIYDPAAADVRLRPAAVPQDGGVLAPGLFQGIGQDRHVLETPLLVQGPGQLHDGRRPPGGVEGDGPEGVAENVSPEEALGGLLSL